MLNFYFTITFYVDGRMMLEHASYVVREFMSVKAWRQDHLRRRRQLQYHESFRARYFLRDEQTSAGRPQTGNFRQLLSTT